MEEATTYFRLILAALFLTASWSKVRAMATHLQIVREYKMLPEAWSRAFGRIEVAAEFLVGSLLLLGLFAPAASAGSLLLLTLYSIAIAANLVRGRKEISCGCGGALGHHVLSWLLVVRNIGLMAMSLFLMGTDSGLGSLQAVLAGEQIASVYGWRFGNVLGAAGITVLVVMIVQELTSIRKQADLLLRAD